MSLSLTKLISLSMILMFTVMLVAADTEAKAVSNSNLLQESDILAEYDGGRILREDILNKINKLPEMHRGRFLTTSGQLQVLDIVATEEIFYQKALDMGIDQAPEVLEHLSELTDRFYLQEYYKRNVTDLVELTDEDLQQYYNENLEQFYQSPNITIFYIQTATEQDALDAKAELEAGASFADVSDKYNQNTYSKGLKGVIKNIRLNGNIPGVGNDYELENFIKESEVDQEAVNGPFQTEMGWHIFRTTTWIPGRQKLYDEVKLEVEQRLRPLKDKELLDEVRRNLKQKYSVSIDSSLVEQINLLEKSKNSEIEFDLVVSSPNNELKLTVQQILIEFEKMSPQEQIFYTRGEGAIALIEQKLIQKLFLLDAKALGYEQYFNENEDYNAMQKNIILRKTFEKLVIEQVEVSDEEVKARYELNKENYTIPAHRSIQVLFFEDHKTANKAWRKFNKAHKKNKEKDIEKIIQKYSTKPSKSIYENQYNNGVVTGLMQDEEFSKRIWDNPVGYLSDVFEAANGDIIFFRTISETPKSYRPAVEVEPRIFKEIKQEKERTMQETVTEELAVEYNLKKYPERIKLTLSAEKLFEFADNASRNRNFKDATIFYDQIIENFPNGEDDYKASFMKAFLVAEEMKDNNQALQLFRAFLETYPEGELHESAQFMIDSLEGNLNDMEMFEE